MAKIVKTKEKEKELSYHEQLHKELDADKEKDGHHYGYATGNDAIKFPEKISTGSLAFDIILDGGYRCGWSRFSGKPQMGKTAQGLVWGANWQKKFPKDGMVVIFNAEGRVTTDLIIRSGIDVSPERFLRLDSNIGDYVVCKMQKWITHNPFGKRYFFLVDSSDALNRIHDLMKGAEDAEKIGGGATLLSFTGKRLSLPVSVLGHHLYITSQLRDNLKSTHGGQGESGGNAPKFYSSLSGRVKPHWVKGSEDGNIYADAAKEKVIGHKTLIELYKSPNEAQDSVLLHIENGRLGGIWKEYELLHLMEMYGLAEASGSWFAPSDPFGEQLVNDKILEEPFAIQGELKTVRFLEANPQLVEYVTAHIKTTLKITT